ncbi:3-isopropylmalate dehydratase large subunit [Lichenifustis flavocetrariae]|uniref:3-isopropylmalate dehydratase large subunit n=1 Tax=Lichenifustis flavocetrariae TaxID=2949735 RepID=A0AA42CRJ6_9HYPH|nr:3-isopropylmalate dehydratase large subunit [Lichenifustis flavocetrariae]MCW6512545.1 3-isopropylmalate dehydratase large subunit [Lichenifustis flavocetrariae]
MTDAERSSRTMYDKVWARHVVKTYDDGTSLLYVDRHLVQEVSSPQAFAGLRDAGRTLRRPDAHVAVADHAVSTKVRGAVSLGSGLAAKQVARLADNAERFGIPYVPTFDRRHGIVHVIGPELGFTLPGAVLVCGDSHTCTHGAFGALAFGIGASECESVFATQTLRQAKQKRLRVWLDGALPPGLQVKDVILAVIAAIGAGGGTGYAMEFAGSLIPTLSMEQRMTMCNMAIEAGSRVAMIAPDATTFAYLKNRPLAPKGAEWGAAVAHWTGLASDADAVFDREAHIDVAALTPIVSWGTSPEECGPVTGLVPDPAVEPEPSRRARMQRSLDYMALTPGMPLAGIAIDRVFIGSCTNGRIEDLRSAAAVVAGRHVAESVRAIVVPGSASVRLMAEAEGLDQVFQAAGFEWRHAGCSLCVAMNDDRLLAGERCASTSNRNFEGRQGVGARTHLMSPAMAAAAAVTGHLCDVRTIEASA